MLKYGGHSMKKTKKLFAILLALMCCLSVFALPASAAYNRTNAVKYARDWSDGYDMDWFTLDSDCTNFVSTCECYAGVVSYIPSTVPVGSAVKKYCMTEDTTYWYMKKVSVSGRPIGYQTCWSYSSSWAFVSKLRTYFNKNTVSGSNKIATVKSYSISNATNINTLCKALKAGDIVQVDNSKCAHSVIISTTGTTQSTVKYCGHSNAATDKAFSNFISFCKNNSATSVYVIHFD